MKRFILLTVVFHLGVINCGSDSGCTELRSCADCIEYAAQRCVWCAHAQNEFDNDKGRCQPESFSHDFSWCPEKYIQNPNSNYVTHQNKSGQFTPQYITVKLRPGVAVSIDMIYKPDKDYPLDLYFLMDNSDTMRTHADQLAKEALNIYESLKKATNNVLMGIGTFIEKPALPYANERKATTYAFKHHLSLTNNTKLFEDEVKKYINNSGGNYDSQEAGLDALMQVMKCTKEIGWRVTSEENSRKIIIVATDSSYHSAGDGKMIGAFRPNDMKCQLVFEHQNLIYNPTIARTYDYPSVSQINYEATKNGFTIIFAATKNVESVYTALSKEVFASQFAELGKTKIVDIIMRVYNESVRNVNLNYMEGDPSIETVTKCGDGDNKPCSLAQGDSSLEINAQITATKCTTKNGDKKTTFKIKPFGIPDCLVVDVEINCQCPCEEQQIKHSANCTNAGNLVCGVCICDTDRSGDKCEIKCSEARSSELNDKCKENTEDTSLCTGHGQCSCGLCKCETGFSGVFCQHNNAECAKTCPSSRGSCFQGECVCKDPLQWTGPTCNCPVEDTSCIGPFSNKSCSGRGRCECGKCTVCNQIEGRSYYGPFCESCEGCETELCEQLKKYAECNLEMWKKNENNVMKEVCDSKHSMQSVKEVYIMNMTEIEKETRATLCRKSLDDGDIIVFKYQVDRDDQTGTAKLKLMIQNELESPPIPNYWYAIAGVVGGILLIGLLTLAIWKISTHILDKREYEKFCKEATNNGFDVTNPVYQDPNVSFVNPNYKSEQ